VKSPKEINVTGVKDRVGATTFALELARAICETCAEVCLVNDSFAGDLSHAARAGFVRSAHEIEAFLKVASRERLKGFLSRIGRVSLVDVCNDEAWQKSLRPVFHDVFDVVIYDRGSKISRCGQSSSVELIVTLDSAELCGPLKDKVSCLINSGVAPSSIAVIVSSHSADALKKISAECLGAKVFLLSDLAAISAFIFSRSIRHAAVELGKDGVRALKGRLIETLVNSPELKNAGRRSKDGVASFAKQIASSALASMHPDLSPDIFKNVVAEAVSESLGMGPLEELAKDPSVTEIMVNSFDEIFVEKNGVIEKSSHSFANAASLSRAVERIVAPVGRRVDESSPMADARLPDGSRVNVIVPPVSLNGPVITVRRFASAPAGIEKLLAGGSISRECAEFLKEKVTSRANILVSGGTGSGKTTLLNVLSSFVGPAERIICVEDSSELKFANSHVIRLEARPPNIEGGGEITIRDLVKNAMRMRPDRIIVGECRGGEALDMLQAMNTGHSGSMTTIHANSPPDSLSRLETLALFAGVELPVSAIRRQIASAISVIVHLERKSDGRRVVGGVVELAGLKNDEFVMKEVYSR